MADESSEWRRRADRLQHQIDKNEAVANADRETRRAEMSAMKSDLAATLTRFEAKAAEDRAEDREKAARDRAEDREAAARARAEDREAAARARAESKQENERLRTDMEKNSKWQIGIILAAIAVATGFLGIWLRQGG